VNPIESRERILNSAAIVFATYGLRHATFEEIAAAAGVSRTLLYRYFDGKIALLRAVRERALSSWAESVTEATKESVTALDALETMIGETFRFASARPDFRAFLLGDARLALHDEDSGGSSHSRRMWREQTAAILARGVETGEIPAELDIRASADALCAMQLGVIEQMYEIADTSLTLGSTHLEAACRILVSGVSSSPRVPVSAEVIL
jgi:AcrR family transcriptional regulator